MTMSLPDDRFLNTRTRVGVAAGATLAVILAFAAGDYLGQHRNKSLVDQSISQVLKHDALAPKKSELERAAIDSIIKATGDQWANYFPTATTTALTESLGGRYSGIGVWLRVNRSGVLEVSGVQPKSPAALAGVKPLDVVVNIGGQSMTASTVATAVAALRGAAGTQVAIQLSRNDHQYRVNISRATVSSGDVVATPLTTTNGKTSGILYVQVAAFSMGVTDQVHALLTKYSHAKGVVLDLRDNPGGIIDEASRLASLFLSTGPVVSYSVRGGDDQYLTSSNTSPDLAPMTVLINRSSASAAEVVAGALQDRNRAVVLGEKSYGKGTVQNIITLSDGSKLEITVGKYRTPSGRAIDGVGIQPDLPVTEDVEIPRAIQVLGGLATLDTGSKQNK
jgi:carboxyl-terminal processing protease